MSFFELSEKQRMLVTTARKLAVEKLRPVAMERELEGRFPWDSLVLFREHGFTGLGIPREYGGQGGSLLDFCLVLEEIARVCNNSAIPMMLSAMLCIPILAFGTEEQKQKYIPGIASGEALGCYALTEPNAGSDAAAIESRAVREEDYYVLNGNKCFISDFTVASLALIMARTDTNVKPSRGITAFIVEKYPDKETPGFSNIKVMPKWSERAIPTCEFTMQDLRVPAENILGKEGEGFKIALSSLDKGRACTASRVVGVAQGAIDECLEYVKTRKAFGHPIGTFEAIQFKLADMQTKVDAARLLTYRAAVASDAGDPEMGMLGAMAKLYACDIAHEVATEGAQIFGGVGFLTNNSMCRRMLDSKGEQIAEGSQEIQHLVIARHMLEKH